MFAHEDAVYGLSVSPVNDNIFASSSDDGRVLIWDIRESPHGEPFCLANYPSAFHSVMFNPVEPRLLATANSKEGVGLWDIRKPQSSLLRYGGNLSLQSAMSHEHSGHSRAEAPEDTAQDTNNSGSVEHSFETKKLNGKALSKALSSRAEEPPSPPAPKASGSTLNSESGNCPRTQSDDSEERSLETISANHNNGRLHPRPPHPHNNGQNFGELEAVACSSPGHSDNEHNLSFTGGLLHKDCCGSEMACETLSAGMREDPTDSPGIDSSRAVHGHGGLKRHRVELEDTDSENSSSEKKLKT
ncbi:DDB1- and CUL4-associated factor 5 [Myotis davidii]|uniref:DDB1-and CUL4-associated factor 5 n=1 Tax=Myotis davidii TaxID=225400 RepID=L5LAZ5_MYODS|nr:DDB1- and CUL4-associated factor 5 [Myotis davidii]